MKIHLTNVFQNRMLTVIKPSTSPPILSVNNDYDVPQSVNTDYNMVSDKPTNFFWLKEPAQDNDNTKIPPSLSLQLLLEDQMEISHIHLIKL